MTFRYRSRMTSTPTVSAARGCSPTARVRRPHRDRNRRTCRTMTKTITDIVIGPCSKNISISQPMTGMSTTSGGRRKVENVPAPEARVRRDEQPVEVAGEPDGGDVDDDAADDLVGADGDGQPRVQRRQQPSRRGSRRRRRSMSAGVAAKGPSNGSPGRPAARGRPRGSRRRRRTASCPRCRCSTMPERSFMTPQSAPRAIGVARPSTIGAMPGVTSIT